MAVLQMYVLRPSWRERPNMGRRAVMRLARLEVPVTYGNVEAAIPDGVLGFPYTAATVPAGLASPVTARK